MHGSIINHVYWYKYAVFLSHANSHQWCTSFHVVFVVYTTYLCVPIVCIEHGCVPDKVLYSPTCAHKELSRYTCRGGDTHRFLQTLSGCMHCFNDSEWTYINTYSWIRSLKAICVLIYLNYYVVLALILVGYLFCTILYI